jgi:hypothetical protein
MMGIIVNASIPCSIRELVGVSANIFGSGSEILYLVSLGWSLDLLTQKHLKPKIVMILPQPKSCYFRTCFLRKLKMEKKEPSLNILNKLKLPY